MINIEFFTLQSKNKTLNASNVSTNLLKYNLIVQDGYLPFLGTGQI